MRSSHTDGSAEYSAAAPAIIAFVSLECLVVAQAISAYFDHFLTVSQMQQRGINHGVSLREQALGARAPEAA